MYEAPCCHGAKTNMLKDLSFENMINDCHPIYIHLIHWQNWHKSIEGSIVITIGLSLFYPFRLLIISEEDKNMLNF